MTGWLSEKLRGGGPWLPVMFFILLLGLALGLASPDNADDNTLERTRLIIGNYVQALPEAGIEPGREARAALLQNGLLVLAMGVLGLHVLGLPLAAAIIFFKGLSLGYATSFLIAYHGISGFIIIFLSMLPQNLLLLPVFMLAGCLSARFALYRRRVKTLRGGALGRYALRFAVLLVLTLLAALVQGYVCPLLLKMFFLIV